MPISKIAAAGSLLLLILLQGCGRKGPLYMPPVAAQPAPAQNAVFPDPVIQSQPEATTQP